MDPIRKYPPSPFIFATHLRGFAMSHCRRRYGVSNFLFDILMLFITGGLWLIWIFVREMRNR